MVFKVWQHGLGEFNVFFYHGPMFYSFRIVDYSFLCVIDSCITLGF